MFPLLSRIGAQEHVFSYPTSGTRTALVGHAVHAASGCACEQGRRVHVLQGNRILRDRRIQRPRGCEDGHLEQHARSFARWQLRNRAPRRSGKPAVF